MYPPLHEGGYELVWQEAVAYLGANHQVRVLTSDHRAAEARDEGDVHRDLRWYWRDHEFRRPGLAARLRIERHNAAVFDHHVHEFAPDVISWWAMGGMSLALIGRGRRAGCRSAAIVCDDWLLYGPRVDAWTRLFERRRRLGRLVERLSGLETRVDPGVVDAWLFPSETIRRRAESAWALGATTVCNQGVSRGAFAAAPPRAWRWQLLYAGRIDRRKGIDLAVRALPALPEQARLVIAGVGDERYGDELRRLAGRLGVADRVIFTSRPRASLRDLYVDADVVVFPVRWDEPWGLVPLEAMSVGRTVVASGRGGSGEYLRDRENCLIFDPDQGPEALAASVREIADDERLRSRLREGAAETSARFGADDFSRAVEEALLRAKAAGP